MTNRNFGVSRRNSPEERDKAALAFAVLVGCPFLLIAAVLVVLGYS